MATAERSDEAPNSAPLGAMGSLLRRLDMLPCTDDGGSISELQDYIRGIRDKLKKLSEVQDPPLTVIYWMKHARELSYDIEAYLDGLDAQTEDSLKDSDAKEGDDPDDSYAKMKDCIDSSDGETEYSVDDSHAEMEDSPNDSDANLEDPIDDDSEDETEENVDNSDSSTQDSICSSNYKISGFRTRAKGIIDRYERFGLDSVLSCCPTAATTIVSPRPSRDGVLVGRGNQITKLISLLQPKDENDNQLKIVCILGDEGIGKSTLIQELWRVSFKEKEIWPEPQSADVKIKRAFVRMGKKPDVRMILRSILSQVSLQEPAKDSGVTNLIQDIRKHLEQKRYFIIVDDVHTLSVWDVVGHAFPRCSFGSRIITTTADKEVALACCSYVLEHNYVMEPLSVGDCKELFIRTVVGFRTVNLQLSKDVSGEIKRRCGGLPLGIMWTAILVASQPEIKEKLCQLETEQGLSKMEKEENLDSDVKKFLDKNLRTESTPVEILNKVLKLCYNSLPHYLKTCLLYLSVYPENYLFLKQDLVKQWIAEGFLCTSEEDKVEAAGRYFDVLISLGLIQRMNINCNKQHHQAEVADDEGEEDPLKVPYIVHPTVFDFITCKSTEDNFITIIDHSQSTAEFKAKIRRLSLQFGSATYATTPASIGLSQVRTLSIIGLSRCMPSLVEFKLVRVVILHLWADDEDKKFVLAEIDKLPLLRYLQARCNVSIELTGQIGCLKHLETLEINSVFTTLGPVSDQRFELLSPMDDSGSTSTPSVKIFELLRPICIFSRLPMWIPQLRQLSILEIVVRELLTTDINMLADLPALTALSLYVWIPTAGNIVFGRGTFQVLKYFKFMCGVLSLDFQEEALKDAINKHQRPTKFNVKRVLQVEEEYHPPPLDPLRINEQEVPVIHGQQTEDSTNGQPINLDKMPAEDTHEHANIEIPHTLDLQEDDNTSTHQKSVVSAHGSPHSFPSPPLPQPRPEAERTFMRGESCRSTGISGSLRSASLTDIGEEVAVVADNDAGGGKLYVAVGKNLKDGKSNLSAAQRLGLVGGDLKLVLLHVHQTADRIMTGLGYKVHAARLEEKELKAYRQIEQDEMNKLLNTYVNHCGSYLKVQAETLIIEKNNVANGIVELINHYRITKLVMGMSSFSSKRKVPKSKVAAIVHQQAKPYCQIFFICRGSLGCSRDANLDCTKADSPRSSSASTLSDGTELPTRLVSMPPWHPGYKGSPDKPFRTRRSHSVSYPSSGLIGTNVERISPTAQQSIHVETTYCSPNSSLPSLDGSPVPASIISYEEQQMSTQACTELERSRKEACEGRQKAERDLFEASMKFKAREISLCKERKDVEEKLTKEKSILEKEKFQIYNELQKANEQRTQMENKLLQTNSLLEELQRLQGELLRDKEDALREVEEMHKLYSNRNFASAGEVSLTEFSYSEIEEATNNFDGSREIGQGGCASVYRGFLRQTTVAIKKFHRESAAGEKEFNNEVEILCRMRHPNLVTLIGVCRDPKVLVHEFMPNGSLEDRLQCKQHTKPLPWRMRVRIAANICTALIFLHSNKPKGIAHGDLKPDNILLDANFVGKLGDFGISRSLDLTDTTGTPYHRTDHIQGTLGYMDPGYMATGELTPQYDVYSFGVVLLRLLTGKSPLGLQSEVQASMSSGVLHEKLDASAGEWPLEHAEELARLALKCCRFNREDRPDLAKEAWGILQAMMNEPPPSSSHPPEAEAPSYFICPITQEIMRDPHIAADGYTYEGDAVKDWIRRGYTMSPMTYLKLTHHELIPNNALRFAIQEWQMGQQQ